MNIELNLSATQGALRDALDVLGFKNIGVTKNGILVSEDRLGITPKELRNAINHATELRVWVEGIKRNHGRIRYEGIQILNGHGIPAIKQKGGAIVERVKNAKKQNVRTAYANPLTRFVKRCFGWAMSHA